MPSNTQTYKKGIARLEKREQAMALRRAGATYKQIGEVMGMSHAGAYKLVIAALHERAEKLKESTDAIREMESDRLDALMAGVWQKAANGEPRAIDTVLRIMERRARLLGLDMAQGDTNIMNVTITPASRESFIDVEAITDE